MTRLCVGLLLTGLLLASVVIPARAQRSSPCRELGPSTSRRDEGLRAVQMIVSAATGRRGPRIPDLSPRVPYSWETLGNSPAVATWKTDGGPMGRLARMIQWGSDEPLPGWHMHWVSDANSYAFTMTDARDACGFSYSADERGTVLRGINAESSVNVVPVESQ